MRRALSSTFCPGIHPAAILQSDGSFKAVFIVKRKASCSICAALTCWVLLSLSSASAQQTTDSPSAAVPNTSFLNLAAELAALSRVNPAQLAAQASANSKLARESSAASSPEVDGPSAAVSPEMLQSLAKVKGSGYGASVPPGLDLAAAVGRPTAAAAFALGTQLAQAGQLITAVGDHLLTQLTTAVMR